MDRKRSRRGEDRKIFQSLSLIMQFGLYMLVPIAMMGGLGYYLDRKLGTQWITIVLFFVGAIAGFQNIYRLAMKIIGQPRREPEEPTVKNGKDGRRDDRSSGTSEEQK